MTVFSAKFETENQGTKAKAQCNRGTRLLKTDRELRCCVALYWIFKTYCHQYQNSFL